MIFDSELMEKIYKISKEGLVIDFERKTADGVNLFCVGDILTIDEMENKMDRYRNKMNVLSIYYNARRNSWESY